MRLGPEKTVGFLLSRKLRIHTKIKWGIVKSPSIPFETLIILTYIIPQSPLRSLDLSSNVETSFGAFQKQRSNRSRNML